MVIFPTSSNDLTVVENKSPSLNSFISIPVFLPSFNISTVSGPFFNVPSGFVNLVGASGVSFALDEISSKISPPFFSLAFAISSADFLAPPSNF